MKKIIHITLEDYDEAVQAVIRELEEKARGMGEERVIFHTGGITYAGAVMLKLFEGEEEDA